MDNLRIRCSELGKIMGTPRKKGEELTETAKSLIKEKVKQIVYDYKTDLDNKYLKKGIKCEDDSIELYNSVFFESYVKNDKRLNNQWIEGECDINADDKIIDIKTSWSKETFPATPQDVNNKDYEWQLRGYMWLYEKDKAELAYCLIDTPDSLIEWENNLSIHHCEEIAPELRVTIKKFNREKEKEELIISKVEACRKFALEYEKLILNKNNEE